MNACLEVSDVCELSRVALHDSERRLREIPHDLCAPFYAEAKNLEVELLAIYRVVAMFVRKEDDLDKVARWWKTMAEICEEFLGKLSNLYEAHPLCGAGYFYDRVLDLRAKCLRLMNLHE